jgi:mono/diheme cytochrome c family protein
MVRRKVAASNLQERWPSLRRASLLGVLLICLPFGLRAQTKSDLTPEQRTGEGLYLRNCAYCHSPRKAESPAAIKGPLDDPKNAMSGPPIGPPLSGLFKGEKALPESAIRLFIVQGFPNKMPGFRYALGSKEINDLISYLKTL